jgi:hypothetical protein
MRSFRVVSLVLLWSGLTAAPSFAVTYSWPLPLSQPVNITNVTLSPPGTVTLTCYVNAPNIVIPMAVGQVAVPVTQTAGGGYSYSGTLAVPVIPAGGLSQNAPPPRSGDIASCALRPTNGNQNIGNPSSLTLP